MPESCPLGNCKTEIALFPEVSSLPELRKILEKGWPVTFDLPDIPGVVISGLALDDRVLIRRTDFGIEIFQWI